MTSFDQALTEYGRVLKTRQPVRDRYIAIVGHPDGSAIEVDERPGFVWVRIDGRADRLRQAYARNVLPVYNLPVRVAYSDQLPDTLEIVDLNISGFPATTGNPQGWDGSGYVGKHAAQHDIFGGDTDWIQIKRLLPLRVRPQTTPGMTVYVEAGAYQYNIGFKYWAGGSSSSMAASVPATAGNAVYRLIYVTAATNTLAYLNTAEVPADPYTSQMNAILALIPTNSVPLAAIYLPYGTTAITETMIFDLRSLVSSAPGTVVAGGAGSGVAWANFKVIAGSGGDYTLIQSGINVGSGTTVWILTGTYAENLTHANGVTLQGGTDFAGDVIVSPAAGVPLTIPATGSHLFETYGMRFSPPAGQIGVVFASGADGTTTFSRCELNSNGASAVDASAAAATMALLIRDSTVNGNIVTKANTTIFDCQVIGNVTQSASAGALNIYGGRITGNLVTVAGSTISLHALPSILGTVSGAGTLVGAYLDGSGNIIGGVSLANGTAQYQYIVTGATPFAPAYSAGFLNIASAKTLTISNSLTLAGTDAKSLTLTGSLTIGADTSITGGGTLALGGFTLTVPATGAAALLATANVFTAIQGVNKTSAPYFYIQNSGTDKSYWGVATSANQFITGSAVNDTVFRAQTANILFSADGGTTIAATIDASSNLGIGIAPSYRMDVYTAAAAYAAKIKNFNNTDAGGGLWIDTRWNTAANRPLRVTTNNEGTELIAVGGDGKFYLGGTAGLVSQVVALAKITPVTGSDGSITITQGIVTAYTAPT